MLKRMFLLVIRIHFNKKHKDFFCVFGNKQCTTQHFCDMQNKR